MDPINFAPALLPRYTGGRDGAPMSREAWAFFMTTIRDAGPQFPLRQAWRDVRDVARKRGWAWPSFPTVWRRWNALPIAAQLHARVGRDEAVKRLAQPVLRDKTTIAALEWVSLDGRTLDFWVDFGDGRAVRPVMIALVDVASNAVLGWE
ncbi:MAG: DNA-binding domain-containing protein, partial [bacterium]